MTPTHQIDQLAELDAAVLNAEKKISAMRAGVAARDAELELIRREAARLEARRVGMVAGFVSAMEKTFGKVSDERLPQANSFGEDAVDFHMGSAFGRFAAVGVMVSRLKGASPS